MTVALSPILFIPIISSEAEKQRLEREKQKANPEGTTFYKSVEKKPFVDSPILRSEPRDVGMSIAIGLLMFLGMIVIMSIIYKAVTSGDDK